MRSTHLRPSSPSRLFALALVLPALLSTTGCKSELDKNITQLGFYTFMGICLVLLANEGIYHIGRSEWVQRFMLKGRVVIHLVAVALFASGAWIVIQHIGAPGIQLLNALAGLLLVAGGWFLQIWVRSDPEEQSRSSHKLKRVTIACTGALSLFWIANSAKDFIAF